MRISIAMIMLLAFESANPQLQKAPASATRNATAYGTCNQSVTGDHNTSIIQCTVQSSDGKRIVPLLNRLLADRKQFDERFDRLQKAIESPEPSPLEVALLKPRTLAFKITNVSDRPATDIVFGMILVRKEDGAIFSYAGQPLGFVKAHTESGGYQINPPAQIYGAFGQTAEPVREGDELYGTFSADCASCVGESYYVKLWWNRGGWYAHVPSQHGGVLMPQFPTLKSVRGYVENLDALPASMKRIIAPD